MGWTWTLGFELDIYALKVKTPEFDFAGTFCEILPQLQNEKKIQKSQRRKKSREQCRREVR